MQSLPFGDEKQALREFEPDPIEAAILADVDTLEQALLTSARGKMSAFGYRDQNLFCEDTPLAEIAESVGTPCYVYSKDRILQNYRHLTEVFSAIDPLICYSVKANANLSILRLLQREGSGFDVVSAGELFRLKEVGADPRKVVFSGVGKTPQEMEIAVEEKILSLNLESVQELERLIDLTNQGTLNIKVALRINPDIDAKTHPYIATGLRDHKFGIDIDQIEHTVGVLREAPNIQLTGLGFHMGSQILDVQPFIDGFVKLRSWADRLRSQGLGIQHLDLGGGFGIPYRGETRPDLEKYAAFLSEASDGYRILMEPGRSIVGDAGTLITRVLYQKSSHGKTFVVVDAGMNDLLRPALYQAYHEILPIQEKQQWITADVVGPICETGDFFARDRHVPDSRSGECLAVMNAGAYGFTLSSNYNSRVRSAEVLVSGDQWEVIRRRETFTDLIRGEE